MIYNKTFMNAQLDILSGIAYFLVFALIQYLIKQCI